MIIIASDATRPEARPPATFDACGQCSAPGETNGLYCRIGSAGVRPVQACGAAAAMRGKDVGSLPGTDLLKVGMDEGKVATEVRNG